MPAPTTFAVHVHLQLACQQYLSGAQATGPKGVALGAAIGGGPGAAIGSLVDQKSANKDAKQISQQVQDSQKLPKHSGATQGMTDPTAQ